MVYITRSSNNIIHLVIIQIRNGFFFKYYFFVHFIKNLSDYYFIY